MKDLFPYREVDGGGVSGRMFFSMARHAGRAEAWRQKSAIPVVVTHFLLLLQYVTV